MKLPSKKKMISFICGVYDAADEKEKKTGMEWYAKAKEQCSDLADTHGITTSQAAGVVAALSPGREWGKNCFDAWTLLNDVSRGLRGRDLPLVGSYGWRNVEKAEAILLGGLPLEVLRGEKVRAFYWNILHPEDSQVVTIDRHAASVACGMRLGEKDLRISPTRYADLSFVYQEAALRRQLLPSQIQAVTWVAWRARGAGAGKE